MTPNRFRASYFFRAITCMAALSTWASGQLIVGNDQSGAATIYNVNPSTGSATPLYTSTAIDAKPWGMAYDPGTDSLYWNNGTNLFRSPMGATLTPTHLGAMSFNGSPVNFVGLGFRNGKLVGTRNIAVEGVYEVDLGTLEATLNFSYAMAYDFGGLDVDATSGILYGLTDTSPPQLTRGLFEINDTTNSLAFRAPYPADETDIDGLAVHNGLAYYVTDGPNTDQPNFYVYDIATGTQVGTLPSPFTGAGTFSAAAYVVPEPSAWVLLFSVLLAGRCRRL